MEVGGGGPCLNSMTDAMVGAGPTRSGLVAMDEPRRQEAIGLGVRQAGRWGQAGSPVSGS